ncbi:efflux RND transporter periplasmic adaptor subunit [Alcanivorax marinus]|uniref:Efflux RND transporter periplasmic adaptor subunit n=1 Tax=Alloalcanivorax marinus TaxID=1177169 RepID=A0A9Q3UQR2_9GAMM|nr:efflux RND transporter periplasmic adaptor subunit [Alloalcanivorax marinus]MBM7333070.1 efflux RND transporter periplasmic adaptor subunit [Alloalcanivorax marinus]MCC4309727.1 efflux RND transporter periplasmic adaptor subunit [Alloalcanivorax marinus]MCU5787132.1 putative Co/Zn/Cd efflux system membrane fusion protein [Alloalcanivorax marinus]
MNRFIVKVLIAGLFCAIAAGAWAAATGKTGHSESEAREGPHGGRLLEKNDFGLELTIFEGGVPPEYRVYPYQQGEPLDPDQVDLTIRLDRLGGEQNEITFEPERDYLLGQQPVAEPHSFDVTVDANLGGKTYQWRFENHEGRTRIPERLAKASGLTIESAGERTLQRTRRVTGRVEADPDKLYRVAARYPGTVERVLVSVGDQVEKGQPLARVEARDSLIMQTVTAPADGVVTKRILNAGAATNGEPIVEIGDFSTLWLELHLFRGDLDVVSPGQTVRRADDGVVLGEVGYLYPRTDQDSQVTRARVVVEDPPSNLRPGMLISAQVVVERKTVPVAVHRDAIQSFRDMPVVFARFGEEYEVRMIKKGMEGVDYVEVTAGLRPGTEYVVENSFLIKADVLKDGATHSH